MNSIQKRLTGIYLVFFALYSIATRFTLTASFMDGAINNLSYRFILIAGCLLALWQLVTVRKNLRTRDTGLLFLFVISLCIGILLNRNYGFVDNVFGLLTFGFQLVLFYYMSQTATESDFTWIIKRIVLLCSFLWDIACLGSIVQYILNIRYVCKYVAEENAVRQGFTDGRLFGLFTDPNFAAFTSLLLIFGLWYVLQKTKMPLIRIFSYSSIVINVIYIVMSNSRTVYLSVIGSVIFFVLFRAYKAGQDKYRTAGAMAKHLLFRGFLAIIMILAVYLVILFPLKGVAKIIAPERNTETEMVREDVNTENISNNRFTIWKAYLQLYTKQPTFGFSMRSAIPYAMANEPYSYLAETRYVTHNSYISLLVETGIVGFLIMAIFMLSLFIRAVRRCRKKQAVPETYTLFAVWILSILIFCLCFHDIFFTLNLETMLFWMGLGYINNHI